MQHEHHPIDRQQAPETSSGHDDPPRYLSRYAEPWASRGLVAVEVRASDGESGGCELHVEP